MQDIFKKYKIFIIASLFFALLIGFLAMDENTEDALHFENSNYRADSSKDKSTALQEAMQHDEKSQEEKQKFLTAAEKMMGLIDFEEEKKESIAEKPIAFEPIVEEIKTEKPKVKKSAPKKEVKTEEKSQDDFWVSVGDRRNKKKSTKLGYKSAHLKTLGAKIKDGDKISIILDEPIEIDDQIIPEDTELFGNIQFQKKRGIIKISRVLHKGSPIACNIDTYDMDGYLGIALDIDVEQEIASDGIDEGINQAASYAGRALKILAGMASSAAKKIKSDPFVKIENKRKIFLSIN